MRPVEGCSLTKISARWLVLFAKLAHLSYHEQINLWERTKKRWSMTIALGIDTGGTYTDAVLVDQQDGTVLAATKALTTRQDLSIGIGEAVSTVLERVAPSRGEGFSPADIDLVGLSTTLATNAIVEGQGGHVCLILIGYDPTLIRQHGFERDLVTQDVVYVRGGHDGEGNEIAPLDEMAVRAAILARRDRVGAFAVSGYFGVRNPAHELRVRSLIEELTAPVGEADGFSFPVTCGHELTTRLNAVRRATTAALNARLIPLLRELIATVRRTLDELGVLAPLMIVKGDGSLVRAEWAMRRPIETILSGPAASVVGARHLADCSDVWVVDVGGTTTDIAVLRDGLPRLSPEGAQVGGWRTMVEAADVHTVGLGGDSHVRLDGHSSPASDGLAIGPRRVVPLCLLASQYPEVVDELQRQWIAQQRLGLSGQFVLAQRRGLPALSGGDRDLLRHLDEGPRSLIWLADNLRYGLLIVRQIDDLVARQVLQRSGFTPTDALHVLGRFERWDTRASRLGAELLAMQAGLSPETFCEQVIAGVSDQVMAELVSKVLSDEVTLPDWRREPSATALLARAMGNVHNSDLDCRLTLRQPVIAVGAPVEAYLPRTTQQLCTELIIPRYAEVANAIGAVAGGVVQRIRGLIRPIDAELFFRLYLPDGTHDFGTLEEAVGYAQKVVPERLETIARQAGADHVEVQSVRQDRVSPVDVEWGREIYLETELMFTAVGRPSLVR
jgi:N-methylhydantoinase A/oxoprolinase/acetone carboxylase beta subunit